MRQLLLASRNAKKCAELAEILAPVGIELLSLKDFPAVGEVAETGATFAENAALKAETVRDATGLSVLADDSGLEVEALNWAPGVYSARFAGPEADDLANNALLLAKLDGLPREKRRARFVCTLALARPDAETLYFTGRTEGEILTAPRGANGFGYDPLFLSADLNLTFAEAPGAAKHAVSHRGRALAEFTAYLSGGKLSL